MKWTKITIRNFLSIKEAELNIDKRGLMLIEGLNKTNPAFRSNGAGKTTIFNSLVYALYGVTSQGLTADAVVNRQEGKGTAVILEGIRGEDVYRIERYRKHSKNANKVLLFRNGKDITEKSMKDTNNAVQAIMGIDYNTFVNSILFSQGSGAGRFSTATDREKKEILENLVNLSVYGEAQEIAKERVKAKTNEIMEEERKGERLQWDLDNVDTLEEQDKERYESTKQSIIVEQGNLKKAVDNLSTYAQYKVTERSRLEPLIAEHEELVNNTTGVDISEITQQMNEKNQELQGVKNEQGADEREKSQLVSQYKKLQTDTHCPVCGTELEGDHRGVEMENIKEQIKTILGRITDRTGLVISLESEYTSILQTYQEQKEQSDKSNTDYQNKVNQLNALKQELAQTEMDLQGHKNHVDNVKSKLDTLNAIPEPKSRKEDRKEFTKQIKAHKKELSRLHTEKTKLEDVVKVYSNSGVKSHILDLITPFLNERANKYLSVLSGSDISVTFSTQTRNKSGEMTDKFEIQVDNGSGGETYESNSEGEKKRIDLAISLAIQDLVMSKAEMSTNFVLYDEVFDALDNVGCENIITLLEERLKTIGSIFVITHSEHLKPLFDQVITATKKEGVTTLQEGTTT